MVVDKLIVTNLGALQTKYGAGFARVQSAIRDLIAKDAARGIQSVLVGVDDATAMAGTGAAAVANAMSPSENKAAVDALYGKFASPVYLVILGAWDIVPHQDLANPVQDDDATVYSDLPYACSAGYSQAISNFLHPTRMVGRIADVIGSNDPTYFEKVLGVAANYKSGNVGDYQNIFAISTATWQASANHTLLEIFDGSSTASMVPPSTSLWPQTSIDSLSHFIDCHGRFNQPTFFGESLGAPPQYPVALDAAYLQGKVKPGTLVVAECCYGAQLYNPNLSGGQLGIVNVYLGGGAYGYFGSATMTYGAPTQYTTWADNLCRYFFQSVQRGSCLGKAAVDALQSYLAANANFGLRDSKTFAQFILLGDPALTPISAPTAPVSRFALTGQNFSAMDSVAAERSNRLEQRMALYQNGAALGDSVNIAEKKSQARISASMLRLLQSEAEKAGLKSPTFAKYLITRARAKPRGARLTDGPSGALKAIYEVSGKRAIAGEISGGIAGVEVHEFDHGVVVYPFVSKGTVRFRTSP